MEGRPLVWERIIDTSPEWKFHELKVVEYEPAPGMLYRAKVPGGWLVKGQTDQGLCFVPDPQHEWKVQTIFDEAFQEAERKGSSQEE